MIGISEGTAELTIYKRENEAISDTIRINVVAASQKGISNNIEGIPGETSDIGSSNVSETNKEHTSQNTALSIGINSSISDSLQSGNSSNWYVFSLAEQGYITIGFEHDQINSTSTYWELYLYRDDGSTYYRSFNNINPRYILSGEE